MVKQYEIFWVNLDPTVGAEVRKTRPCIVISPNEINAHLNTIIIAPITSQQHGKNYPYRISFTLKRKKAWIMLDQIRTIDKSRMYKKIAFLNKQEILQLKQIIYEMLVA